MDEYLTKLIDMSVTVCDQIKDFKKNKKWKFIPDDIAALYANRNGMRLFENSLIFYPLTSCGLIPDILSWNLHDNWKKHYGNISNDTIFIAEDAFGGEFCIKKDGKFYYFDSETTEMEYLASNINEFAKIILDDCDYLTGLPLAHDWQLKNGSIIDSHRLIPKIPFFLGGKYDLSNIYSADRINSLKYKADIYHQTKVLPDGTQVKLKVIR